MLTTLLCRLNLGHHWLAQAGPDGALFRFAFASGAGEDAYALMARCGHVPLPPYIEHTDSADDERRYQAVCALLPEDVTPVRLYESYLTNFEINTGGRTGA